MDCTRRLDYRKSVKQSVKQVASFIERNLEGDLSLARLGREAGLSPFHLQRSFKAALGVTPKQYAEACRLRSLRANLRSGGAVLDSVYASGFGSSSRVYERAGAKLGMTPAQYRRGAQQIEISFVTLRTAFGPLTIAATDRGLCFVRFGQSPEVLETELMQEFPGAAFARVREPWPEPLRDWIAAIRLQLSDGTPGPDLPLDIRATAFQAKVWRYVSSIPSGQTRSYAEVAKAIGKPKAVRAVGTACARNPLAIVIPCHRVIRASGELGGYRWDLKRKQALLDHERKS